MGPLYSLMARKKSEDDNPDDKKDSNGNGVPEDDEFDEIFDDEFFENMNKQLKDIMNAMPFKMPPNFDFNSDFFKGMFKNIMKNLNVDPRILRDMDPKDIQEMMKKGNMQFGGPFMFGFNMQFDPEGKPKWSPFGNVKPQHAGEPEVQSERDPLIDIYEEEDMLVVVAEVPGVSKKDIELRASSNELEILAEAGTGMDHPRKYHKIIPLPVEIDADVAKARYNNGILEVRLEKAGSIDRKKIDIE